MLHNCLNYSCRSKSYYYKSNGYKSNGYESRCDVYTIILFDDGWEIDSRYFSYSGEYVISETSFTNLYHKFSECHTIKLTNNIIKDILN